MALFCFEKAKKGQEKFPTTCKTLRKAFVRQGKTVKFLTQGQSLTN